MTIASDLSRFALSIRYDDFSADLVSQTKTLILDALACVLAGSDTDVARIARRADHHERLDDGAATIFPLGCRTSPAAAALANGAMLRALDLMDVYVSKDVTHPSEVIPAALACTEAADGSGKDFLEAVALGITLHTHLADILPLHRNGLHHIGHAAWVVPLVAGRLLGLSEGKCAGALSVLASGLIVPEGFSRAQVSNYKALAYPLLARRCIEAVYMARDGLTGPLGGCEEIRDILAARFGIDIEPEQFAPRAVPKDFASVTLKAYPAQYALQPLIAAASRYHKQEPAAATIARVLVRASRRTIERAADPSKYRPATAEAADHSLPFCVAVALLDGDLTPRGLQAGRWQDADVLELMAKVAVEPNSDETGYAVGRQEILIEDMAGSIARLECAFPAPGQSWRELAEVKLRQFASARIDVDAVIAIVDQIEGLQSMGPLVTALCSART